MVYNIQIENAFNCVLKQCFIAVGPFSRNKSQIKTLIVNNEVAKEQTGINENLYTSLL